MFISKRIKKIKDKINKKNTFKIDFAIQQLKELSTVKFLETVEIAINLNINPKKTDQNIRGSVILPHGIGKLIKVAVFAQGSHVEQAKLAGADFIGLNSLIQKIKKEGPNFDVSIATPESMGKLTSIGSILGPKGLMPNPKLGTITDDIFNAVKNAKKGQVRFRNDKNGILHASIGKINFSIINLKENLFKLLEAVKKLKPRQSKGTFFKKITLSSTMGGGLTIDLSSLKEIID
ncbi:50S ribosomal protein L1 [Buchnera aphidicola (Mindarus keteleerifoliae)]|uniref:50S ribosomal protein L1 n=1 Tax=Buchnera aphidicola TaxID=9 RepID=UPI0031B72C81